MQYIIFDYAQFGVGVREVLILVPPINIKIFNQIFSRLKKNFQLQNHSIASGVFCDLSAATVGTRWHRAGDASPSMLKPVWPVPSFGAFLWEIARSPVKMKILWLYFFICLLNFFPEFSPLILSLSALYSNSDPS